MSNQNEPSKTNGQVGSNIFSSHLLLLSPLKNSSTSYAPLASLLPPLPAKSHRAWLTSDQINSLVGSAKELVGSAIEAGYQAVGASNEPSSFTTAGQKQHAEGEAEINAAQAQGYVQGVGDRLEGKKDSIVGAVMGDKTQQTSGNLQHEKGATQMNINKPSS